MVPSYPFAARRSTARLAVACALAATLAAPAGATHDHADCPRDADVPEYRTGEIGEYRTGEIPEYVTREIPEYVTREVPEYRPRAGGAYISGSFPPAVVGSAYVEVVPGVFVLAHGKGGRAFARQARLVGSFRGDKLVTYTTYGFPPYRHRENDQDLVTEHWTYPEDEVTFVFCGDRLVATRDF